MSVKRRLFETSSQSNRILIEETNAKEQISNNLLTYLPTNNQNPIVIVCIGTDRSTGDSLGPLVGTFLSEKTKLPFHIYGTLEDPIHAVNLKEKLLEIKSNHPNAFIIAVDACLGRMKNVGSIQVCNGPVKPGAGVNKDLPEVGNIHINGIVNVSGFMEFFVLQNTRLSLVLNMARTIADGIYFAGQRVTTQHYSSQIKWPLHSEKASQ
ncbi:MULTISPECIES: spore protease YyaC [Bacillus]|uniref:spore protease YyaC n=1 Tax=Bacillus TaxID=1386 RepID=UPI00030DE629|nr:MULTISPECIES: spore protease YyaC [Bacillus]